MRTWLKIYLPMILTLFVCGAGIWYAVVIDIPKTRARREETIKATIASFDKLYRACTELDNVIACEANLKVLYPESYKNWREVFYNGR